MSRAPAAQTGELFPDFQHPRTTPGPVAEVAVQAPIPQLLTYTIPAELSSRVRPGIRVRVPLGNRRMPGFVVEVHETAPSGTHQLKPLDALQEAAPSLTKITLKVGLWVARHYGASPGESLAALVPAAVRHGRTQRKEIEYRLTDLAMAEEAMRGHESQASWQARLKALRFLAESQGHAARQTDILRTLGISSSPLQTLLKQGLIQRQRVAALDNPLDAVTPETESPKTLTPAQNEALKTLLPVLETKKGAAFLLHGVTGSGKTEVYLQLLEAALERKQTGILLVPEIALTPQTLSRIRGRIGDVAVLHSNLSDGDRAEQWRRLAHGEARVAVGPRSAIFAPLRNVGVIILDEEHETTFKQQQSPRYHARDVALHRGELEGAIVLLGSATPSMESEGLVQSGTIQRISMEKRVGNRPLPPIAVLDMRSEKPIGQGGMFSRPLVMAMEKTLQQGGQIMLFLNRRGYTTMVMCRQCGWQATCEQCAIQLTHYRTADELLCHYCGNTKPPVTECPDCLSPHVRYSGFGTERVAKAAKGLFPGHRVDRMDSETLRLRGSTERIYNELRDGEIDILVGTQVLAKGLDIPNITLVGVMSADTALLIPDFRSTERTFQLLCQVAGRAGRGHLPGKVLVQTFQPQHAAIQSASRHDHLGFAAEELRERQSLGYPPFGHMVRLVCESADPAEGLAVLTTLITETQEWAEISDGLAQVLGPAQCPIPMIKGAHRHHVLFMAKDPRTITDLLPRLPRRKDRHMKTLIDRDPVALL